MKHVLVYGMTYNPGGMERYIVNFFRRVQGNSVMLDFITDFDSVAYADILTAGGAKIHYFPAKSRSLWGHWRALWKLLREHKEYTAVYFHVLDAGAAVTMVVPYLLGRRIIVHSHNNETEKKRLHKLCRPALCFMANGYVSCSDAASVFMFGKKADRAIVSPNAIDAKKYRFDPRTRAKKRAELGLEGNRLVVIHVGRMAPQKNPLGLLDIFEAVWKKNPSAALIYVGDGELASEFDERVREKHLTDAVMRLGVRGDVHELLQAADVFLLPSLYEGFGIVVLEAQAAGLPSVVSDAVPQEAAVTELVTRLPLSEPPEAWADVILRAAGQERRDTCERLVQSGYDISCCEESDARIVNLF